MQECSCSLAEVKWGLKVENEETLLGKAVGQGPGAMLWRCQRTGGYLREDLKSLRVFFFSDLQMY